MSLQNVFQDRVI